MKLSTSSLNLLAAAKAGNVAATVSALAQNADPNAVDGAEKAPLHYAAAHGAADVCQALIECGAFPTQGSAENMTALHYAVAHNHRGVLEVLLQGQPDDARRRTLLDCQDCMGRTALHYACMDGRADLVQRLLDHGADANLKDGNGCRPEAVVCAGTDAPRADRAAIVGMLRANAAMQHLRSRAPARAMVPGVVALFMASLLAIAAPAGDARAETPAQRADQQVDDMRALRLISRKPAVTRRFERIFRQVERAAVSYDPAVAGRFHMLVANAPEYTNAESYANGVLVITEAFASFPNQDIAFVLGHELAHEELDHPQQHALLSDEIRGQDSPNSFQLRVVFGEFPPSVSARLRGDEMAADATACLWLQRAGISFDATAFFKRLAKQPIANPTGSATHPSYLQRIENLRTLGCAR